jgi:predicted nuclease of predicted toxin-antitoxin system
VKLLVDNALSPVVARLLIDAGHDAVHVRDLGLAGADDGILFARATEDDRIVVSADTDFGTILALRALRKPSFVLWRRATPRRPEQQAPIIASVLEDAREPLESGAIVVIDANRIRIRKLPIGGDIPNA